MSAELEKRMLLLFHTLSVFACACACVCGGGRGGC